MGQKVNPKSLRIGIIKSWPSTWFASKRQYTKLLHEDIKIRKIIEKELFDCGIGEIEIQRSANKTVINIASAKPGLIIGRQGTSIDKLKTLLSKKLNGNFEINIKEIKRPALEAKLTAENIAKQIEKRVSYRHAAKIGLRNAIEEGAEGAKVLVSGRLNGVEIARNEFFLQGKVPLHTLRADVDYACVPASTKFGTIGVKVWIYKGEVFKDKKATKTPSS